MRVRQLLATSLYQSGILKLLTTVCGTALGTPSLRAVQNAPMHLKAAKPRFLACGFTFQLLAVFMGSKDLVTPYKQPSDGKVDHHCRIHE